MIADGSAATNYYFDISARYQSPISLAVISATPSWPMTSSSSDFRQECRALRAARQHELRSVDLGQTGNTIGRSRGALSWSWLCGLSRGFGLFGAAGVDAWHDFFGHQNHRLASQLGVLPVLAGIEQRAELADLLLESQPLVGNG